MKKLVAALVVLGIFGATGYLGFQYISKPRVLSTTSEPVTACIDPDGNNIYEAAETAYTYVGEPWSGASPKSSSGDYCDYYPGDKYSKKGVLREKYCASDQLVTDMVDCGFGSVCRDGRCIKGDQSIPLCSDSDGGINANVKGATNLGGVITNDDCYVSDNKDNPEESGGTTDRCSGANCYTYEYSCSGDSRTSTLVPSPQGCLDGLKQ